MNITQSKAFFQQQWFPAVENEINTLQFLDASRSIVWLVDQFGMCFAPVKNDLLGNIEKLNAKYLENTEEYNCLLRMILYEKKKGENHAIESLLWLRRGLKFMSKFLAIFLEKEKNGIHDENLTDVMTVAYNETLAVHHGWFLRRLFGMLQNQCPTRSQFLMIVGHEETRDRELIISSLDKYLVKLETNLEVMISFCQQNNIKPHH